MTPPGEYAGTLPLSAASAEPKIAITARSRDWFIWAALAVLIGSLLGGLLPLVSGIWRRKELLRAELKGVLERYKQVRDNAAAPPIHWHLDDAVGPEPWFRDDWLALPRLQGAGGLYSSIRWASVAGATPSAAARTRFADSPISVARRPARRKPPVSTSGERPPTHMQPAVAASTALSPRSTL